MKVLLDQRGSGDRPNWAWVRDITHSRVEILNGVNENARRVSGGLKIAKKL